MRYAILSDIHANMQAWEAVLNDLRMMHCDVVLCLGDIVGYGPKPAEVLESVCTHAASIVVGDHDAAIGGQLDINVFSDDAREALQWTRSKLSAVAARLFADMESYLQGEDFVICHSEMDLPERFSYIREPEQTRPSFAATPSPLIFAGHTHEPGVFTLHTTTGSITRSKLLEVTIEPQKRYFVNVGSVGHPLHGDTLATYAVYDSQARRITFRGVPFNLNAYAADVVASGLPVRPAFLPPSARPPAAPPAVRPAVRPAVQRNTGDEAAIRVALVNPHRRSAPIRYVTPEELLDTSRTVRLKKYDSPLLRRDDPAALPMDTRRVEKSSEETASQPALPAQTGDSSLTKRKPIIIKKRSDAPTKPRFIETPAAPYTPPPKSKPEYSAEREAVASEPDTAPDTAPVATAAADEVETVATPYEPPADPPEPEPEPEAVLLPAEPVTPPEPEAPPVETVADKEKEPIPAPAAEAQPAPASTEPPDAQATDAAGISEEDLQKEKLRKERARQILLGAQKRKQAERDRKAAFHNKLRESLKARQAAALQKRKDTESGETLSDTDKKNPDDA